MFTVHEENNQKNYSNNAKEHDALQLNIEHLAYRDLELLIKKYLPLEKQTLQPVRVLDFGCGSGFSTEIIAKIMEKNAINSVEIHGLDINIENIKLASGKLPQAFFHSVKPHEKINHIGTFDLIICCFVLVENKQDGIQQILEKIHSILGENGVAIFLNCTSAAYKIANHWSTHENNFIENVIPAGEQKIKEDQPIKIQVNSSENTKHYTFSDFFHSGFAYKNIYKNASFELMETHKPIANPDDKKYLKQELKQSPYRIDILKKSDTTKIFTTSVTNFFKKNGLHILHAHHTDLDQLMRLVQKTYQETYPGYFTQQKLDLQFETNVLAKQLQDKKNIFYIIKENNTYIGYAKIIIDNEQATLDKLYLLQAFQGKGYGQELLKKCLSNICNHGINSANLFVFEQNTQAIEFYLNNGFTTEGKKFPYVRADGSSAEMALLMECHDIDAYLLQANTGKLCRIK